MRKKSSVNGLVFVALGLGLSISLIFPEKFIIVMLAIALVICGVALCKA